MAFELLTQAIDNSGFSGFSNLNSSRVNSWFDLKSKSKLNIAVSVISKKEIDKISKFGLNKSGSGQYIKGNDVLLTYSTSDTQVLNQPLQGGLKVITLSKKMDLKPHDTLVIATINRFYFLDIQAIDDSHNGVLTIELINKLPDTIPQGSMISKVTKKLFYIGQTTRKKGHQGHFLKALYVKYQNRRYELIPNINQLNIDCIYRENGKTVTKGPLEVMDWSKVIGLKITLKNEFGIMQRTISIQRHYQ